LIAPADTVLSPLSLEDLMYKYGTDKSKDDHKYSDLYAMLFDPIRGEVRNALEVGVEMGRSLMVWHDYFPDAAIYGIDIFEIRDPERVRVELDSFKRVQIFKANSQHKETVDALGLTPNSMDIVIDDGDHSFVGQERTLNVMWPYVRPGGYYIIEDVGWDRGGDPKLYPILSPSHYSQPRTLEILEGNDSFFADTALGHRSWDLWQKRSTTSYAVDRSTHNSHLVVIRKRISPLSPVSIKYRGEGWKQWKSLAIMRNAPCRCGSGKRYKHCHGKLT
jgi:hypothetical protein